MSDEGEVSFMWIRQISGFVSHRNHNHLLNGSAINSKKPAYWLFQPFAVDIAPIEQAKIAGMKHGRDTITKVLSLSYRCIHRSVYLSTASVIQMFDVENMHRRQYASTASSSAATAASSPGNRKDPEDDSGRSSKKRVCSTLTEMTDL